jgi:hypothetical protein
MIQQDRSVTELADPAAGRLPSIKPGKLVIDVEEKKVEFSALTADDAAAMRADRLARLEALRQRWQTARDREALLGALIFYQTHLPEGLFKGLMEVFEELTRNPNATRFLAVRYAHDTLGMTMDAAYDWASENLADSVARGGRDVMMKSYQKIRSKVATIDRIQPRPRARGDR